MGVSVHGCRIQPDLSHDFGDHVALVATRFNTVNPEALRDDLFNRHPWAQTSIGVLKDNLHIAAQCAQLTLL